jgi:hypothetical protein
MQRKLEKLKDEALKSFGGHATIPISPHVAKLKEETT